MSKYVSEVDCVNKIKFAILALCLCLITPIFKYMQVAATRDRAIEEMKRSLAAQGMSYEMYLEPYQWNQKCRRW